MKIRLLLLASLSLAVPAWTQPTTLLVNHTNFWRYHKGTNAPQADWRTSTDAALDATWPSGRGGFGYADNDDATILSDMRSNYSTIYIRQTFTNAVLNTNDHLFLIVDFDDGFIAWLDGAYLGSFNSPSGTNEPAFNATASGGHEASHPGISGGSPPVTNDLLAIGARLPPGPHVLALIGLNDDKNTSSDLSLIADLYRGPPPPCGPNAICADTNWTVANSPYVISANLTVTSGATLTIEPGVTVQLGSGINLMVADGGRLLAEGNETNRIRFTRATGATTWGGITINGGLGSPETRIAYADFEFNGSTAIHSSGGTLFLDHCTFAATDHQYLSLDGSSFVVSDCHFPSATALFENVHGTAGIKSGGRGIFIRNFFGVANSVSGNYNDVLDFTGGNRPGPIVHFINNVFIGSGDDLLDLDSTDAWIEGNIFLHAHKNGSPDTASAVSGGKDNNDTSEITIVGNIIYDCDQAAMAKQGNFYTLMNNTIVHQTHQGGFDTDGAVVALADEGTTEAVGMYLEGNIIYDAEKLVRFLTAATVTFSNNLMPFAWGGPGGGNSADDPMLKHIPLLSETVFTDWAQAQVMWDWFSLLPGSPAIGTGPNGRDKGGVIPLGASISGEPDGTTAETVATLTVGVNRTGHGIPATPAGWPSGSGYTHYRWRLDTNAWSVETPITTPITVTGLADGPHHVEVTGKRDSGFYQDDPVFGADAVVTVSRTWTVATTPELRILSANRSGNTVTLSFLAEAGKTYSALRSDTIQPANWVPFANVGPLVTSGVVEVMDPNADASDVRFYRLVTPVQ